MAEEHTARPKVRRLTHPKGRLLRNKLWFRVAVMLAAPFIIGGWCLANPKKVLSQAKKDWGQNV